MNVGIPFDMQKPRASRTQPKLTKKEWEASERYQEAAARYTEVKLTSKIDVVVEDMKKIIADVEDNGGGRPAKIVIFSNFAEAFSRIAETCDREGVAYGRAPAVASHCESCTLPICEVQGCVHTSHSVCCSALKQGKHDAA